MVSANGQISLETSSLGSCVAVALYDALSHVAGLCHILLDQQARFGPDTAPGRCADTAVAALVLEMVANGATGDRLTARLAGGSNMFSEIANPIYDVSNWNIEATRDALASLGIPILAENVGGTVSRRLRIDVATGRVVVRSPACADEVI